MYHIHKTKRYEKEEAKYRSLLGDVVFGKMEQNLSEWPFGGNSWGKLNNHEPPYRYKIADYRVFYEVNKSNESVLLRFILARKDSYKKR
jgi:mRNA-degrading endonuclease RelE of RelBE toxin-antitoxin system